MQIIRKGSQRNRGTTTVLPEVPLAPNEPDSWKTNVRWDTYMKRLVITTRWVLHTDGETHHNYDILLDSDDISALVAIFGHAGAATDASLLRDHLNQHLAAIVKLLACATGLLPLPLSKGESNGK